MSGAWLEYVIEDEKLQAISDQLGHDHNLHITICYFGRSLTESQVQVTRLLISKWVKFFPKRFEADCPLGFSLFSDDLIVQRVFIPSRISLQRDILLNSFFGPGIQFHNDFDWNPHVTLGKKPEELFEFGAQPEKILVKKLWFHHDFDDRLDQWDLE